MVADRIKHLRKQHDITQADLARKLCITRSSINAWELGISVPSTQSLVELADIFDVSTDYLLGRKHCASVGVSGLTEQDIEIVQTLIAHLRSKNKTETGKE